MDKMREEFEKVAKENGYNTSKDIRDGFYCSDDTDNLWLFWRKSRAALVVELPPAERHKDQGRDGYCYRVDRIEDALDKAGVKYE